MKKPKPPAKHADVAEYAAEMLFELGELAQKSDLADLAAALGRAELEALRIWRARIADRSDRL